MDNDFINIFDDNQELNFDYDYENINDDNDDQNDDQNNDNNTDDIDNESNQDGVGGEDDNDDEGDDDNSSSPNLFQSIAETLYEQGILPSLDLSESKIENVNDFINQFQNEIEIQSKLKLQHYLNNLDLDKIASSRKEIISLDNIDETYLKDNLDKAKEIIFQDYINQGLSEDKAKKLLRKTIDLGEDVVLEDALDSLTSLKEYNKRIEEQEKLNAQKRIELERQEQIKTEQHIKSIIENNKEIVQGVPNSKILQDKVYKTMVEPVSKNPETGELMNKLMDERYKDPIAFDIKMYYIYELTNGFNDFSNVSKKLTSKTVENLEKTIRKTKFDDNGLPTYMQDPNSYLGGSFGSELVL